jgi:hypothetical protein
MQDLSFDFNDPVWEFNNLRFAVQVFTFENVYGLDPDRCTVTQYEHTFGLECGQLTCAGAQEHVEGDVSIAAVIGERKTTFRIEARAAKTIRCVKLILKGLPLADIINLRETNRQPISPKGLTLTYPSGWRDLYTPLVIMQPHDGSHTYFRSLDTEVRPKRFAFLPRTNQLDVELIFEEAATKMQHVIATPAWEVGTVDDPEVIAHTHTRHVEQAYRLVTWEQRPDVPDWARHISLVAAIHCRHWTGYVFNDYAKALTIIEWLASKLDGKHILAYLPGWEGRYYWQYGDYRPDPRLGGEQGFAALVEGARRLGVAVMPMFGINYVNKGIENFEQWGKPAQVLSAGGNSIGGGPDWDGSRHHDHGWGAMLNPGAPTWQNRLVEQITHMVNRFGFTGVYLDISAVGGNDPHYHMYLGILELVRRIREHHPELLIAGEGWYDGIGAATPLVMSGHTDETLHWHDQPYPFLFDTYNRCFGHLVMGDPGRGSTGVHEFGRNPYYRVPLRKGILPTLSIVEDTLERAPDKVMEIIDDAKRYAATYVASTS